MIIVALMTCNAARDFWAQFFVARWTWLQWRKWNYDNLLENVVRNYCLRASDDRNLQYYGIIIAIDLLFVESHSGANLD